MKIIIRIKNRTHLCNEPVAGGLGVHADEEERRQDQSDDHPHG